MDKAKVISAYVNGFITLKECEQILGMDSSFILGMIQQGIRTERRSELLHKSAHP